MHYESDCVCTHDFCKHWLSPWSFLFSNSALGEDSSIKPQSKIFLLDREKWEAGRLHSWFIFPTVNSFLPYQIVKLWILSYLMQTQPYLSTTSQNDRVPLSCCLLHFHNLPPTVFFASLLIVCWFGELRGKNATGKSIRVMYFPLFASWPCTLLPYWSFCIILDVACCVAFDGRARLRVTFRLSRSGCQE